MGDIPTREEALKFAAQSWVTATPSTIAGQWLMKARADGVLMTEAEWRDNIDPTKGVPHIQETNMNEWPYGSLVRFVMMATLASIGCPIEEMRERLAALPVSLDGEWLGAVINGKQS